MTGHREHVHVYCRIDPKYGRDRERLAAVRVDGTTDQFVLHQAPLFADAVNALDRVRCEGDQIVAVLKTGGLYTVRGFFNDQVDLLALEPRLRAFMIYEPVMPFAIPCRSAYAVLSLEQARRKQATEALAALRDEGIFAELGSGPLPWCRACGRAVRACDCAPDPLVLWPDFWLDLRLRVRCPECPGTITYDTDGDQAGYVHNAPACAKLVEAAATEEVTDYHARVVAAITAEAERRAAKTNTRRATSRRRRR